MIELELEIARNLGASAFLVYSIIKNTSNLTRRELQIRSGLSENCIAQTVKKLQYFRILNRELKVSGQFSRYNTYTIRDCLDWKIQ